jgi:Domain of unknown function (DUF4375)
MVITSKLISVIMFASILKLLGCSGPSIKNGSLNKNDTLDKQISQSIEDFKNRPVHKKMTAQIIDTTKDVDLLQSIFDNITDKFPKDYEKEYQTALGLSKARQAIYIIWYLEAEVNNGGYNQFYYNSSRQYASLLPSALKLVRAIKFADLTERANAIYKKENDKITKHLDGSVEGFSKSYDDNPLNKFDDEFYELYSKENLQQLQVNFIREHKQEFIDN